jgi:hypothetical protein
VKQLELAFELLSVVATRMCHALQSGHMAFWCGEWWKCSGIVNIWRLSWLDGSAERGGFGLDCFNNRQLHPDVARQRLWVRLRFRTPGGSAVSARRSAGWHFYGRKQLQCLFCNKQGTRYWHLHIRNDWKREVVIWRRWRTSTYRFQHRVQPGSRRVIFLWGICSADRDTN